jgi:hypothetical protein
MIRTSVPGVRPTWKSIRFRIEFGIRQPKIAWPFRHHVQPPLHRLLWVLLERHPGVEPIAYARSRRMVQVAQHDHRLVRLRIHAKNPVHSRSAAAVAVGPRLLCVRPGIRSSRAF